MSPVSRARKGHKSKKPAGPPLLADGISARYTCDCPACASVHSDVEFDAGQLIDDLTASAFDLVAAEEALDAEMVGAALASICASTGATFEEALVSGFVPAFEAQANAGALAMLLAIGAVTEGRPRKAAATAAERLVRTGIAAPQWAAELAESLTVTDCRRIADTQGIASLLACSFHRAGRSHSIVIRVDDLDCGAAADILLLETEQLPVTLDDVLARGQERTVEIIDELLDAAQFRWEVEKALDARAVHDRDDRLGVDDEPDVDGPPDYPTLAWLVRARMRTLPVSGKPRPPHGNGSADVAGLLTWPLMGGRTDGPFGATTPSTPRQRADKASLPAKRVTPRGPAQVYQIKVGLRGAKPPIWRRLEVPSDICLDQLHLTLQAAFGWEDCHMHVFETPYGEFGVADAMLGHQPEAPVTLRQVAPKVGSTIRYTYDFGDDWQHDIVVEKVLNRGATTVYPRCTGGRRAAPPEDCGGMWGYADLIEILADPSHPEHEERLEWMGLAEAAEFTPDSFDADEVTEVLSTLL